jgi:hypothetical protein
MWKAGGKDIGPYPAFAVKGCYTDRSRITALSCMCHVLCGKRPGEIPTAILSIHLHHTTLFPNRAASLAEHTVGAVRSSETLGGTRRGAGSGEPWMFSELITRHWFTATYIPFKPSRYRRQISSKQWSNVKDVWDPSNCYRYVL